MNNLEYKGFEINDFLNLPVKEDKKTLAFYERIQKEKKLIDIQFNMLTKDNLVVYPEDSDNIRIELPLGEVGGLTDLKHSNANVKSDALGSYLVEITSIDKKRGAVCVSAKKAQDGIKERLLAAMDQGIEIKEYVKIDARVINIPADGGVVIIDLGGLGIGGYISRKDWSPAFTSAFKHNVEIGSVTEVLVKRKAEWETGPMYQCSRRETITFDPWRDIETKMPKGTIVKVKCLDKTEKNFFGKVEGLKEINVYCEYPSENTGIYIREGALYAGYVTSVNEKNKLLKVRIAKEIL